MEHRDGEIKIEENIAFFKAVIYNIYEYVNEDDEDEEEIFVYTGKIVVEVYNSDEELVMAFETEELSIPLGEATILQFEFPVGDFPEGEYYIEMKCDHGTIIYPSKAPEFYFEIDLTSVNKIEVDDDNKIVNVVGLDGRIIKPNVKNNEATQGLAPGIYFIGNKKIFIK